MQTSLASDCGCRGPLICSYVIQNLSWQFGFWFVSIPLGLNAIAVFFFVPEVSICILHHSPWNSPIMISRRRRSIARPR